MATYKKLCYFLYLELAWWWNSEWSVICLFVCLRFYAMSTVFQLLNCNCSQIHVSRTIFNQYLTCPLSWHWQASCSTIPIILSAKGESQFSRLWSEWLVNRNHAFLCSFLHLPICKLFNFSWCGTVRKCYLFWVCPMCLWWRTTTTCLWM